MKRLHLLILILAMLTTGLLVKRFFDSGWGSNSPSRITRTNDIRNFYFTGSQKKSEKPHYNTPWKAISAHDYSSFISIMRASGCPERTIQDMVLMQLAREFKARRLALDAARHNLPEWWHSDRRQFDAYKGWQDYRQLQLEMDARVQELLGVELDSLRHRFMAFDYEPETWIRPEKRLKLDELELKYRIQSYDIKLGQEGWCGPIDQNQIDQLTELQKQKENELATLLSPTELKEYTMRKSEARWFVLENLRPATSEDEFRMTVQLAIQYGIPENYSGNSDDSTFKQQVAALQTKIDSAMGQDVVAAQNDAIEAQKKLEAKEKAQREAQQEAEQEVFVKNAFQEVA